MEYNKKLLVSTKKLATTQHVAPSLECWRISRLIVMTSVSWQGIGTRSGWMNIFPWRISNKTFASIISHRVAGGKNDNCLSISQSCSSSSTARLSSDATQQSYFGPHSVFNGCSFNFQVSAVHSPPKKGKYVIYSSAESSQESWTSLWTTSLVN